MLLEKCGIKKAEVPDVFKGERLFTFEFFLEIIVKEGLERVQEVIECYPLSYWMFIISSGINSISRLSKDERVRLNNFSKLFWRNTANSENKNFLIILPHEIIQLIVRHSGSPLNNLLKIISNAEAAVRGLKKSDLDADHMRFLLKSQVIIIFTGILILSRVKPANSKQKDKILKMIIATEKEFKNDEPLIISACELARKDL
jgi:hypothetical protein